MKETRTCLKKTKKPYNFMNIAYEVHRQGWWSTYHIGIVTKTLSIYIFHTMFVCLDYLFLCHVTGKGLSFNTALLIFLFRKSPFKVGREPRMSRRDLCMRKTRRDLRRSERNYDPSLTRPCNDEHITVRI